MASFAMIEGPSGSGKSSSIRNLNEKTTFVVSPFKSELPFKGWKQKYKLLIPGKQKGNFYQPKSFQEVLALLNEINNGEIYKTVVLDDFQLFQSYRAIETASEKGFDKFIITAELYLALFKRAKSMRDDITVFFLSQTERTEEGYERARIGSKFIGQTIGSLESFFNIVLKSGLDSSLDPYNDKLYGYFQTRTNGYDMIKSPFEMFKEERIPNDLELVRTRLIEYNEGE